MRSQRLCCLLFKKPSALIAATTGPNAEQILANIKCQFERKRGSGQRLPRNLRPDPGTLDADGKLTVAIDVT